MHNKEIPILGKKERSEVATHAIALQLAKEKADARVLELERENQARTEELRRLKEEMEAHAKEIESKAQKETDERLAAHRQKLGDMIASNTFHPQVAASARSMLHELEPVKASVVDMEVDDEESKAMAALIAYRQQSQAAASMPAAATALIHNDRANSKYIPWSMDRSGNMAPAGDSSQLVQASGLPAGFVDDGSPQSCIPQGFVFASGGFGNTSMETLREYTAPRGKNEYALQKMHASNTSMTKKWDNGAGPNFNRKWLAPGPRKKWFEAPEGNGAGSGMVCLKEQYGSKWVTNATKDPPSFMRSSAPLNEDMRMYGMDKMRMHL